MVIEEPKAGSAGGWSKGVRFLTYIDLEKLLIQM